jgi:hypothetical protein
MKQWHGILRHLRVQQSDQVHLLILIPSLTLVFLSLIARTASSAIDLTLEKKKVTEQLKHRLSEVQNDEAIQVTLTTAPSPPLVQNMSEETAGELAGDGGGKRDPRECSVSPSLPHHCLVRDPTCARDTCDLTDGSALGQTPDELLHLTPHESRSQSSPRISPSEGDSKGHTHTEGKEARDTTWGVPFRIRVPGYGREKLARRVVSLTIAFEQGAVSPAEYFGAVAGDFDGQGLSFGLLQWNLGSCSLQPLLTAFLRKDPPRFRAIMDTGVDFVEQLLAAPCEEALSLARRVMLDADGQVQEPWLTRFRALGHERAFQEVQVQSLLPHVQKACRLAEAFGFHSERAVALFFDILVQNGGIPPLVRTQYEQDIQEGEYFLGRTLNEVERMQLLANRQAEAANPKWADTVRARKLTIVQGEGSVNGISYNLEALGIGLRDYKTGKAVSLNNGEATLKQRADGDVRG